MLLNVLVFVLGLGVLVVGAEWLVRGARAVTIRFGMRPLVVGLIITALGIDNIQGSNLLNILFVVGVVSLLQPVEVEASSIRIHFPVMRGVSLTFYPLALPGQVLSRAGGTVLLTAFFVYMGYLGLPYIH